MGKKVTRLYEQFQPEQYDLALSIDRDAMKFSGTVTIKGKKVGRPTERLTFHQKDLKITRASAIKHSRNGDSPVNIVRINKQNSFDEVRLHADAMVYPGEYTVTMDFEAEITRPMNGIYPCFFTHDGQEKKLIATQFESHHAREAFPCIDEPEAKATFDLTLVTPDPKELVVGNTPIKHQMVKDGKQVTSFETTPVMSVYLLAFVFGDMEFRAAKTKDGVAVRAYATPDNVHLVDFGMQSAVKFIEFFSEYFDTPYPLPKLDMVALPDFNVGAMENWGLMTFRETAMLTDPKHSSIDSKQVVALVVSHEVSHQWFGNLVTMKWWDDLWLNESFANMMEYMAVDAIYPEWKIWEQFVSHESVSAKRRDSLADVQPVKTGVNHPDEINTIFDPSIVYAKGGTLLHMLMHHVGEAAFRTGLKAYFDKHHHNNTVADDLWEALSNASGKDIGSFMNDWLTRPGYPLVTVGWQPGDKAVKLSQARLLNDPSAKVSDDKPWQVPLASTIELEQSLLSKKEQRLSMKGTGDVLLLNHDGQSYFVPQYSNSKHLRQITDGITAGKVGAIDRLLLLDNYIMLQRSGQASTTNLLDIMTAYKDETSEAVWGALAMSIAEVRRLIEFETVSEAKLDAMVAQLVTDLAAQLGWDDQPNDTAQTLHLRGMIISLAVGAKVQAVIEEGLKRFQACAQPSDLPPSTRSAVYFCAARYGSVKDYKKLLRMFRDTKNAEEKDELGGGLTAAKDSTRYQQVLKLMLEGEVRRQDFFHYYIWLLRNRYSRADTWKWLIENWQWYLQEFKSDKNFGYAARFGGSVFGTRQELVEFTKFFKLYEEDVTIAHDIALAKQEINSRIAWRERNHAAVKRWLKDI